MLGSTAATEAEALGMATDMQRAAEKLCLETLDLQVNEWYWGPKGTRKLGAEKGSPVSKRAAVVAKLPLKETGAKGDQ